jgi:hypothetical protein
MPDSTELERELTAIRSENPEIWVQSDETGAIRVSVGVDGSVETVQLAQGWWRRVRPEEAGTIVLTLARVSTAARGQTVTQLAAQAEETEAAPSGAPTPSTATREPGSGDRAQLTARMNTLFTAFSQLDEYRRSVNEAAHESTQLRSPSGGVVLEVTGGAPRTLTIDGENAQFTSEQVLEGEIVDLFARADQWLADRQQHALDELPDLRAVVQSVHARERPGS